MCRIRRLIPEAAGSTDEGDVGDVAGRAAGAVALRIRHHFSRIVQARGAVCPDAEVDAAKTDVGDVAGRAAGAVALRIRHHFSWIVQARRAVRPDAEVDATKTADEVDVRAFAVAVEAAG